MDFIRIGEKIVSREMIDEAIDDILNKRAKGMSQAEVAADMGIDRTFISRLETLGELRKGGPMALVGFPLGNVEDVKRVAKEEGVEFVLVMNDVERWDFVKGKTGIDLFNDLMSLIGSFRKYRKVILIGSDRRLDIMKGLLDKNTEIVTVTIGHSPVSRDVTVDLDSLRETIKNLRG